MKNFLFYLNEVNPRSVYRNKEGVLIIKGNNDNLNSSERFKKKYDRFIVHDENIFISLLRYIFHRFYGLSYLINPPLVVNVFKFLFMPAPKITKYGSILDIGCSTGEFLDNLPNGWEKSGIEINERATKLAKKKGLKVENCSLENYKTSRKFDLIRACHVIEHFNNYDIFFKKVDKLLKIGSLLVIYTPNSKSLSLLLTKNSWGGFYENTHFQIFDIENLTKIAAKYNLKLITSSTYYMGVLAPSFIKKIIKISNPKIELFLYYFFSIVFFPFSFIDKIFMSGDSLLVVFKKN